LCNIGSELRFTGRRTDPETGLQLNRYRFYASHLGRWINRDPILYWGGPNLYEYVRGNPTIALDPTGLRLVKCCRRVRGGDISFGSRKTCKFVRVPDAFKASPCSKPDREESLTTDEDTAVLYCLGDPSCESELRDILDNANKPRLSNYPGGIGRETCNRWAISFRSDQLDCGPGKKCSAGGPEIEFDYNGNFPLWNHHMGNKVCFPSGACIYLDNGWLGGDDHIFFPGQVPPEYTLK